MVRRKTETIYNRINHLNTVKKYILNNIGDNRETEPAIININKELKELNIELLNNISVRKE